MIVNLLATLSEVKQTSSVKIQLRIMLMDFHKIVICCVVLCLYKNTREYTVATLGCPTLTQQMVNRNPRILVSDSKPVKLENTVFSVSFTRILGTVEV